VFIECEPFSICFTPFEIPPTDAKSFFTAPAGFHSGGRAGVVSYADAHAETHRWMKPGVRPVNPDVDPHPSPSDRRDVAYIRMQSHHLLLR